MSEIIQIKEEEVFIGTDNKKIIRVPRSYLNFDNPKVGDKVKAFKGDDTVIIVRDETTDSGMHENRMPENNINTNVRQVPQTRPYAANEKRCNKHVFVWVCNFLFGSVGVDRFIRGQIGLGILKIVTGGAIGVWTLVDFIISLTKAYGNAFHDEEDVVFINGKYAV